MRYKTTIRLLLVFLIVVFLSCNDEPTFSPTAKKSFSPNNSPVILEQTDTTASLGDTLVLWAFATDPDGDSVVYNLDISITWGEIKLGLIPDAQIDRATGRFWFRPQNFDIPSRSFSFIARDGRGATDFTNFIVYVN